jgi:hypothetical protein
MTENQGYSFVENYKNRLNIDPDVQKTINPVSG